MTHDSTAKTRLMGDDDPDRTVTSGGPKQGDTPQGPIIPDVTLDAEIGRGGMGVVYRGRQTYLDRQVAVKLLLVERTQADDEYVKRFQREAKILAGLSHPHIVACYSAGVTTQHHPYLVMEFIDGPNLKEWVSQNGPLSPLRAVDMIIDLVAALSHAHANGIIHRDVKPENVLLARRESDGDDPFPFTAKLVDLGLARPARERGDLNLTAQGTVMGTPTTMAPEQFEDPDGVDFRADIYGLGCVLYYALTGSAAFVGKTIPQLVTQKLSGPIPNPCVVNPQIPSTVGALVRSMLAKDRDQRPSSYERLREACVQIRGPTGADKASAKQQNMIIVFAAIGALALAGVLIWLTGNFSTAPAPTGTSAETNPTGTKPKELGKAQSLFAVDLSKRLLAWTLSPDAQWSASEDHEHGVAGVSGRIERLIPTLGDQWEAIFTMTPSNGENASTRQARIGLILDDGRELYVQANNNTVIQLVRVEMSFADKETPSEIKSTATVPVAETKILFRRTGRFVKWEINGVPYDEKVGLKGDVTGFFVDTVGDGPLHISDILVRLPSSVAIP